MHMHVHAFVWLPLNFQHRQVLGLIRILTWETDLALRIGSNRFIYLFVCCYPYRNRYFCTFGDYNSAIIFPLAQSFKISWSVLLLMVCWSSALCSFSLIQFSSVLNILLSAGKCGSPTKKWKNFTQHNQVTLIIQVGLRNLYVTFLQEFPAFLENCLMTSYSIDSFLYTDFKV